MARHDQIFTAFQDREYLFEETRDASRLARAVWQVTGCRLVQVDFETPGSVDEMVLDSEERRQAGLDPVRFVGHFELLDINNLLADWQAGAVSAVIAEAS